MWHKWRPTSSVETTPTKTTPPFRSTEAWIHIEIVLSFSYTFNTHMHTHADLLYTPSCGGALFSRGLVQLKAVSLTQEEISQSIRVDLVQHFRPTPVIIHKNPKIKQ